MNLHRPFEVTASHLAAQAAVYVRQSTEKQTLENVGSLDYQRGQTRWPTAWGWPPDAVRQYEDLGLSGSGTEHRPRFLELVRDILQGRVKALFASDQSRLARDAVEWIQFLRVCKAKECLIVLDGHIVNQGESGDAFASQIMALVDEQDSEKRLAHFRRGTIAKVEAGKAVTRPPTGYVAIPGGKWELHPDPAVRHAISEVFRIFLEERSSSRTVRRLRVEGCQIPRQFPGKPVRWIDANHGAVLTILTNPVYRGDYVFRRRIVDRGRGKNSWGRHRVRVARAEEQMIVPDHHAAYVSRETWEEIAGILARNAPSKVRRNLGPGSALVQGVIRCSKHDRSMGVDYRWPRRDGTTGHYYHCMGLYEVGGPQCGVISGGAVDRAVAEAIFARLDPPSMRAREEEWKQAQRGHLTESRARGFAREQAARQVDDLRARYRSIDPSLRDLAADLEIQLNAALGNLKRLQATSEATTSEDSAFTPEVFKELNELVADLPGLFYASTTEHRDRKEIIRILVERVEYLDRTPELVRARIVWADGAEPTEVLARLNRYAHRMIAELAQQGLRNPEIAAQLNAAGLRTNRGRQWTTNTVWQVRQRPERAACVPKRQAIEGRRNDSFHD